MTLCHRISGGNHGYCSKGASAAATEAVLFLADAWRRGACTLDDKHRVLIQVTAWGHDIFWLVLLRVNPTTARQDCAEPYTVCIETR